MRNFVEIYDRCGKRLYRGLIDTGGEVMRFADYGFITKSQCREHGWEIRPVLATNKTQD